MECIKTLQEGIFIFYLEGERKDIVKLRAVVADLSFLALKN